MIVEQTVEKFAEHFETERLVLKVVEECMELCEVLVKGVTKAEGMKPPVSKIIEEMGDLRFRMKCLAKKLLIEEAVEARVVEKAEQLNEWYSKKFNNG